MKGEEMKKAQTILLILCAVIAAIGLAGAIAFVCTKHKAESNCGHYVTEEICGYAATCTESGLTTGIKCAHCGEILVEQTEILSTRHNFVGNSDTYKPATCTEPGLTAYSICSVCGTIGHQKVIPARGHDVVQDAAVAPTCMKDGLTEGTHCSRCGEVFIAQEVVPAKGEHTNIVAVAGKAPTCTESGTSGGERCADCGHWTRRQTHIKALGHQTVIDEAVAPTETESGLTEGTHCSRCGEVLVAQEVIPPTGKRTRDGSSE